MRDTQYNPKVATLAPAHFLSFGGDDEELRQGALGTRELLLPAGTHVARALAFLIPVFQKASCVP